jgi:hypothetical protein
MSNADGGLRFRKIWKQHKEQCCEEKSMTDSDLTGCCGLYCGDCIRYKSRASDLAKDLLREFEKMRFSEYAKVKQSQIPEFEHYEAMVCLTRTRVPLRDLSC